MEKGKRSAKIAYLFPGFLKNTMPAVGEFLYAATGNATV